MKKISEKELSYLQDKSTLKDKKNFIKKTLIFIILAIISLIMGEIIISTIVIIVWYIISSINYKNKLKKLLKSDLSYEEIRNKLFK